MSRVAGRRLSLAGRSMLEQVPVAPTNLWDVETAPRASISPLTGLATSAIPVMRHPQFEQLDIVECVETGVQYVQPPPSAEMLRRVYDEDYNAAFGRCFKSAIPDFVARRAQAQLACILAHGPVGAVAEAGGGWGALCDALQPHASSVVCYELDSQAVGFMRDRGIDARLGMLEHHPSNDLDLVVSSMMLEHLPNPLVSLRAWKNKLKKGGKLFLEVPLECPVPNWWGADPTKPYWVGHLTFLAKGHTEIMLQAAGYVVLSATCHDHPVSPGYCMPGEAPYDLSQVPVELDTQVSTSDYPKLVRVVALNP